MKAETELCAVN